MPKIRIRLEPPRYTPKTVSLSEDFRFRVGQTFPSPYRESNDVRTRKDDEILMP